MLFGEWLANNSASVYPGIGGDQTLIKDFRIVYADGNPPTMTVSYSESLVSRTAKFDAVGEAGSRPSTEVPVKLEITDSVVLRTAGDTFTLYKPDLPTDDFFYITFTDFTSTSVTASVDTDTGGTVDVEFTMVRQ